MGEVRCRSALSRGRRGIRVLLCVALAFLLLFGLPLSALASGNVLFWSTKTAPPDTFISGFGGTYGGYLWCFGGLRNDSGAQSALTDVYRYDPTAGAGGSWTLMPSSIPPSVDPAHASTGSGFTQVGNKVYMFGGRPSTTQPATNKIYSYDLSTGMTTYEGSLTTARGGSGVAVVGGYAYVVGGQAVGGGYLNTIEVVDLLAFPGTMSGQVLPITLSDAVTRPIVFSNSNFVYVFGGLMNNNPTPYGTCSNQALKFDPGVTPVTTASWLMPPTAMPYGRQGHHQKAMAGGYVYVTGDALNNDVLEYDLTLDQWSLIGSQPQPLARSLSVVDAAGTTVYDINGLDKATGVEFQTLQAAQIVPATSVGTPATIMAAGATTNATAGSTTIQASFDTLTNPGSAQLNVSVLPTTSLPSNAGIGFRIQGQVYDIATTASGWGTATITLPYTGTRAPVIRHWTGSAWVPITVVWPSVTYPIDPWTATAPPNYPAHNPANGRIISWGSGTVTFETPSLSPFAIEEPVPYTPSAPVTTPASSDWSLGLSLLVAFTIAGVAGRRRLAA